MVNSTTNSRTSPVTAPPVSFAHNEYVIVLIPNSMKGKKSVKSTGTIIKTDITTKPKIMTVDFSKPVVLKTTKFSSVMNSTDIGFIKPDSIDIRIEDNGIKKLFIIPTTKIIIVRISTLSSKDKIIIERKNSADSIIDWNGYVRNDSDDGNCGTEIKHKSEPEL